MIFVVCVCYGRDCGWLVHGFVNPFIHYFIFIYLFIFGFGVYNYKNENCKQTRFFVHVCERETKKKYVL